MDFKQFKLLVTEINPNLIKSSSEQLAKQLKLSVDTVKEYRAKIKEEKANAIPYAEEIEEYELNSKIPKKIAGFEVSSFKDGNTWYKKEESKPEFVEIDWNEVFNTLTTNILSVHLSTNKQNHTESRLFCIADVHCGMKVNGWNKEIMNERFLSILNYSEGSDHVEILSLGDGIDGLNSQTTRGGHRLPQDMSNQEQILNLVNAYQLLFDGLANQVTEGKINSFGFSSCYESNHSGDMDYVVGKFLEMWLNVKYPEVLCDIQKSSICGFSLGNFNIYFSHGKDQLNQKYGFPLYLNEKTELYLTHILKQGFKNFDLNPKTTVFISGDLHTQAFSQGKFFKYYKVPAMSPSSDWVKANYGESIPGIQYFTFKDTVLGTSVIEF